MSYLVEEYPVIFRSNSFGVLIIGRQNEIIDFNSKAADIFAIEKSTKLRLRDLFEVSENPESPSFSEGRFHGVNLKGHFISIDYSQFTVESVSYSRYILVAETSSDLLTQSDFTIGLINSMPGQFYLFNEQGEMLLWNDRLSLISGYSNSEVKSMSALEFFPEEERSHVYEKIQEVFSVGESMVKANILTKSGKAIPHKLSGKRIRYMDQTCVVGLATDISDLIGVQDTLKYSTKQLKTAQEIAHIGYWEWNWYDKKYYWSDEMYTLCDVPKENGPLQHLDFATRIHRKDLEILEVERKRIVKTLNPGKAEFRFFLSSGEMRFFLVNTSPIIDGNGRFISLEGTIQDITERKEQEAAVRLSNERYELISKATNDAVWDWDIQTNKISGNANYLKLFGVDSGASLTDITYFSRIHPDDRDRVKSKMTEALISRQKTVIEEYRFKNHKGKYRFMLDRSQIIYGEHGVPLRMVGAMQDITSQKKAEEDLQNITNRLSLATTSAKLGVFDWNIEKDELEWNEYMYEIFDVDPSDFDKSFQSWLDCLHQKDVHYFDLLNNEKLFKRRLLHTHIRVVPFSEEVRYVEIHAVLLPDKDGKVYSVIGVCRDISEKVLSEQAINRAIINTQESERFEIGRELHDNAIQVLIAALMNLNHIHEKSSGDSATNTSIELTKKAINEIRRLSHQLAPSDLGNLAIEESIRDLLKEMNINNEFLVGFETDIEPDAWIPDDMKMNLYRIMQEQLNNIYKHSKATEINIELTIKRNKLVLKTMDNGIGFETHTNFKGIGINNMERRVRMFEGDIEINSSPNNGCEIIIQIPIEGIDY